MNIKLKALKKGYILPDHKYGSLSSTKIHLLPPVRFVEIILDQHCGSALKPTVAVGDYVSIGTKIADSDDPESAPLHSSVSGRVGEIRPNSICIESDESDRIDASIRIRSEVPKDEEAIIELIRQAGIIDLGGSSIPTHVQIKRAREKKIHTLIINGCESEPFLTSDHTLMLNQPVEVLKGVEILRVVCGAENAVIVAERNKLEVIEILNSKNYNLKFDRVKTAVLPVRYPQGSERVLAESHLGKALLKNETSLDHGVFVQNVATAFAVYEAVYLGKPLYERVVTIGGPCVFEPKNVWVRNGVRVSDLVRSAKGFLRDPQRLVLGGPMTGEAIAHLDTPITKKVSGVLALSKDLAPQGNEQPCIRCGLCVDVCPESLVPETLMRAVKKRKYDLAREFEIDACTECGLCAYVCPSRIPLVRLIRAGKSRSVALPTKDERDYAVSRQAQI